MFLTILFRFPAQPAVVPSSPTNSPTKFTSLTGVSPAPTALPHGYGTISPTPAPSTGCEYMDHHMPTGGPTSLPGILGTPKPVAPPTLPPTSSPVAPPTPSPTGSPIAPPTASPTGSPIAPPTPSPTGSPVAPPTPIPTGSPVAPPTPIPTGSPVAPPTPIPTGSPVAPPTPFPTGSPVAPPTPFPTGSPVAPPPPTSSPTKFTSLTGVSPAPTALPHGYETISPTPAPSTGCEYMDHHMPTGGPTSLPGILGTPKPVAPPTTPPTSSPVAPPTYSPVAKPIAPPTPSPTGSPNAPPTPSPTGSPIAPPSPSPSGSPIVSPTSSPTGGPVAPPTFQPTSVSNLEGSPSVSPASHVCLSAFMYCPGISTCFDSMGSMSVNSPGGWSVDFSSMAKNETTECELWAGATGCDMTSSSAIQVGIVEVNDKSVTFFTKSGWGGQSFEFYAGACQMSDGGAGYSSGVSDCSTPYQPYEVAVYPLVSEPQPLSPPVVKWSFGKKNQQNYTTSAWTKGSGDYYQVFPLAKIGSSVFLAGHAEVCECQGSTYTESPTSIPILAGSSSPVATPTLSPTSPPTASPTSGTPTGAPVSPPTSTPTSSPVAHPSPSPTATPVSPPTATPTSSPVASPTSSPSAPLNCETAFVYCPGRSTCFLDPLFNCYTQTEGVNPWGWNILYKAGDGVINDCQVWIGANNCTFENGEQIGTASISSSSFTVTLNSSFGNGYKYDYNFYAGECIGSDGGNYLTTGVCLADDVALYAHNADSYPLTSGVTSSSSYTFSSTMKARQEWGSSYQTFPIGSATREYLSAEISICPLS